MCRLCPADRFGRDAASAVRLPPDLLAAAGLTLYPFASSDLNALDACSWGIHDEGFERLRAGAPHPAGTLVMAWHDSRAALDVVWGGLSRDEQDLAVRLWRSESDASPASPPSAVAEYLRLAGLADSVYAGLQRAEEA